MDKLVFPGVQLFSVRSASEYSQSTIVFLRLQTPGLELPPLFFSDYARIKFYYYLGW